MPVEHGTASEYAKEMRKWNAHHSEFGPPGRPYENRLYPTQMYRAERVDGRSMITDGQRAENEDERRNLESRGYVFGGQQAAMDALAAAETEAGRLHAELIHEAKTMSAGAQREFTVAEAKAEGHIASVPETPIAPRKK